MRTVTIGVIAAVILGSSANSVTAAAERPRLAEKHQRGDVFYYIKRLHYSSEDIRLDAIHKLADYYPTNPKAIQALIDDLEFEAPIHTAETGRINLIMDVIGALGKIGTPAVPGLIRALRSPIPHVRNYAANSLAEIGRPAHAALPALREALYDSDGLVRGGAREAIDVITH